MLQFHKSRNANEPIRNVILYGDTKEYIRITRDLEQMDINTSVIAVPKNVKGYQNLEFALYANAIGAMFSRNKATEKINLLEFGGAGSVISDRVKSDSSFGAIFAVCALVPALIMGGIIVALKLKDNKIVDDIEMKRQFVNSSETAALIQKHDQRIELRNQVQTYKTNATLAADALKTRPYATSEVYRKIEDTIKKTVESENVPRLVYDPDFKNDNFTFLIEDVKYDNGKMGFKYSTMKDDKPASSFNAELVKNFMDDKYFAGVINNGYKTESQRFNLNGPEEQIKAVGSSFELEVASPVTDANTLDSLGGKEK